MVSIIKPNSFEAFALELIVCGHYYHQTIKILVVFACCDLTALQLYFTELMLFSVNLAILEEAV